MDLDRDSPVPLSQQLAAQLRTQIRAGKLPPGRPIPSKRAIQEEHGLAVGTINKALAILRDEGLIYSVKGMGTYVAEPGGWRDPA